MFDLIHALLWGACASVVGFAVVVIYGEDDTPTGWYFKWAREWQERGGWRSWIASPLGGCVLCTSGQIGLWSFAFGPGGFEWSFAWPGWGDPVSIALHWTVTGAYLSLLSGCAAVLCAFIINAWYQKKKRHL